MSLSRKALKEIQKSRESEDFDLFMDEGVYMADEPGNCYLRWTHKGELYKGQTHILKIRFNYGSNVKKSYPRNPPNITFLTPIWHTNVGGQGAICLDILKEGNGVQSWSPMYGLDAILNSIQLLMDDQNPSSPMNGSAGSMYKKGRADHDMSEFIEYAHNYYIKKMDAIPPENFVARLMTAPEFEKPEVEIKDPK